MKKTLLFLLMLAASNASADRTINIAIGSDKTALELTNPSASTVSYSVKCYGAGGAEINSYAGQTLAANASTKHTVGLPDSGACAAGYTSSSLGLDRYNKKVYACTGGPGVTYANAQSICGVGRKFCFPPQTQYSCGFSFYNYDAWLKNETGVERYDNGTCSWVAMAANEVIFGTSSCTNYQIRKTSSDCAHFNLDYNTNAASTRGAICCEDPVAAGVCKVTIVGAAGAGHLASPQFKGGAPF